MGRKLGTVLILAVTGAFAAPGVASAATTRYVAPAVMGTSDCSSPQNACSFSQATTSAQSGDTIAVLANFGDYQLAGGSMNPGPTTKSLHYVGINGRPRIFATTSATLLDLPGAGSSAANLYIENDGTGNGLTIGSLGGSGYAVDRVFVKTGGATAEETCFLAGGVTLTNSVCWQADSAVNAPGIFAEDTDTLRNDTSWVTGNGAGVACESGASGPCTLTVVNTIAGHELLAFATGGLPATINVRYSNFPTTLKGGATQDDHINSDSTDQSAVPQLVNATAGDFHELSASPTIDAGITDPANGPLDLDSRARTVGGKTDIGAYELGSTTSVTPGKLTAPDTKITKSKIKKHKHRATFIFKGVGTTTRFECALIKRKNGKKHKKRKPHFVSCSSPKTYKHLKHGKYTFEVRAVNSAGPDPTPAIKHFKI